MPQSKLTVELIGLSANPTIRTMFTNNEVGIEIDRFVANRHLLLEKEYTSAGKPTGFLLTGELGNLNKFIQTFKRT